MQETDLVIVGGGFAGLSCARVAAARGVRTVVLERKGSAGEQPHTTGILVKEVADEWDFPRHLTHKIQGVRLYSPSFDHLDLTSPGYYFLATDTPALLDWLAQEAAAAGAELRFRQRFDGAHREGQRLVLPDQHLRGRYLIGCDGARSRVATHFGLGKNRQFLFGVEAEYEGIDGLEPNRLHVFLNHKLAPGYIAWVVPGVGITQVGMAGRCPYRPNLDKFVASLSELFDLSGARRIGHRAGLIPCGGTVRPFARDSVMLLGDAAGMVSPLTAGGIHMAMQTGRVAGIAVADYLLDDGPVPERALRQALPSYVFKKMLRMGYDLLPSTDRATDLLFSMPLFREFAQTIFFHHRGLLSMEAWRDVLRICRQ